MEDTWGIPADTFAGIYVLGFSAALLFAFAVRILTRSGAAVTTATASTEAPYGVSGAMSAQDYACLTGGPRRVVEAAVAQLVGNGQLRTSPDGYLEIARKASGSNPVEKTVLADVARHGRRSVSMLTNRLAESDAVGEVVSRLVRAGYLVDGKLAARRKVIGLVPVVTVFSVGVLHWLSGIANDRPVGWLTLLLLVSGCVGYAMYRHTLCPRTFEGSAAVARERATAVAAPAHADAPGGGNRREVSGNGGW